MNILSSRITTLLTSCVLGATLAVVSSLTVANAGDVFLENPPAPMCEDGAFLWTQEINVDVAPGGIPFAEVRFWVGGPILSYTIEGPYPEAFGSRVALSITDAVAWDGYASRLDYYPDPAHAQPNERWRVVFLKDGIIVASSKWTGESDADGIDDGLLSDFWQGALDEKIVLEEGTNEIRLVHWGAALLDGGTGDRSTTNSVVPTSVCISEVRASLGDRVWLDDGDNVQSCTDADNSGTVGDSALDCSNPGVPGVPVTLLDVLEGNCSTPVEGVSVQYTDADGFYLFNDLNAGKYCVSFEKPAGFECVTPNVGADPALDSDGVDDTFGQCVTGPVTLNPGDTNLTVDLGLTPALGDRVWEDLNGNGIQDCTDTNNNGIIGDSGDTDALGRDSCEPGVPDVEVTLGIIDDVSGNCELQSGTTDTTDTDADGFYMFTGLELGVEYCAKFDLDTFALENPNFCTTDDLVVLGAPLFTTSNAGTDDAQDSNVQGADGVSDGLVLSDSASDNLSLDAGIVCPAKIGDFVWFDDEDIPDGLSTGDIGVPAVRVELYNCDDNPDVVDPLASRMTNDGTTNPNDLGMYMFGGDPKIDFDLAPGCYFVKFYAPNGYSFTTLEAGDDDAIDSNCGPDGATAEINVDSGEVDLKWDCGLVETPPNCNLVLDKTCSIVPETSDNLLCESAISATTLRYIGPNISGATVTFAGDKQGFAQYTDVDLVSDVTVLTMGDFTIDAGIGEGLGSKTEIMINGDLEIIHTSCSAVYVAGEPAPLDSNTPEPPDSNKGDPSPNWFVVNFRDKDGASVAAPGVNGGDFTDECSFELPALPSCDNGEKPEELTWRYDGGTGGNGNCDDSTFLTIVNDDGKQHEDFECSGSVELSKAITVTDDSGYSQPVNFGDEFVIRRDDIGEITLMNGGGKQTLAFHTSCSQPLEAHATAGALTLVGLDGRTGGVDVTYHYLVTNNGDPLNVTVTDDKLGFIGGPVALNEFINEAEFEKTARLFERTVNTGTVTSNGVCPAVTDKVIVDVIEPTCAVSIKLDKVEDKKIKWKLSNSSSINATIDNLTISWPGDELLKKVKFDGNDILKDVALTQVVLPSGEMGVTITSDMWQKELKDRTLEAGDSGKTLEFEFTDDFPDEKEQSENDFDLTVNFGEGCSVTF